MRRAQAILLCAVMNLLAAGSLAFAQEDVTRYVGACDASGAVAVGEDVFLVVDNEDEVHRLYRLGDPEPLNPDPDFHNRLGLKSSKRADLEGAAQLGDLIFVVASNSDNSNGESRPDRRLIFAVRVTSNGTDYRIELVGQPYRDLKKAIEAVPDIDTSSERLNIEGLAATLDGQLLLGLRSPRKEESGKNLAIVVSISNPLDVIAGGPAKLGRLSKLDLEDRGIRSLEYDTVGGRYLIVAGPSGDTGKFDIYAWPGPDSNSVEKITKPGWISADENLTPESLFFFPSDTENIYLLSDDGELRIGEDECKDLKSEPAKQGFRGFVIARD